MKTKTFNVDLKPVRKVVKALVKQAMKEDWELGHLEAEVRVQWDKRFRKIEERRTHPGLDPRALVRGAK